MHNFNPKELVYAVGHSMLVSLKHAHKYSGPSKPLPASQLS